MSREAAGDAKGAIRDVNADGSATHSLYACSAEQETDAKVRPEGDGVLIRGGDDAAN